MLRNKNVARTLTLVSTLCVGACATSDLPVTGAALHRRGAIDNAAMVNARPEPPPKILPETHFAAGRLFEAQGAIHKAIEQYKLATLTNHFFGDAYHRLGLLLCRVGMHDEAIVALQRAAELKHDSAIVRNNLGFCFLLAERWFEAEQAFREAIALRPDFARAHVNLGIALSKQGRFDDAFDAFAQVLPETDAYYNVGLMLAGEGRMADAAEAFQHALDIDPGFTAAATQLAKIDPELRPDGEGVPAPAVADVGANDTGQRVAANEPFSAHRSFDADRSFDSGPTRSGDDRAADMNLPSGTGVWPDGTPMARHDGADTNLPSGTGVWPDGTRVTRHGAMADADTSEPWSHWPAEADADAQDDAMNQESGMQGGMANEPQSVSPSGLPEDLEAAIVRAAREEDGPPSWDHGMASTVVADGARDGTGDGAHGIVVDAGRDQTVRASSLVTLRCIQTGGDQTATLTWEQVGGPEVSLVDHGDGTATFVAPADPNVTVTFKCTGAIGSQTSIETIGIAKRDPFAHDPDAQTPWDMPTSDMADADGANEPDYDTEADYDMSGDDMPAYAMQPDDMQDANAADDGAGDHGQMAATVLDNAARSGDTFGHAPSVPGGITVDAGDDQTVRVSSLVRLKCVQTGGDEKAQLTWVQVGGPPVNLVDHGDGTATFIAPRDPNVVVTFKCTGSRFTETTIETLGMGDHGATPGESEQPWWSQPPAVVMTDEPSASDTRGMPASEPDSGGFVRPPDDVVADDVYVEVPQLSATVVGQEGDAQRPTAQVRVEHGGVGVDAGSDQAVFTSSWVTLRCVQTDGGARAQLTWVQTGGPKVTLIDHGDGTASFQAPADPGVTITFRCIGSRGAETSIETIAIKHEPPPEVPSSPAADAWPTEDTSGIAGTPASVPVHPTAPEPVVADATPLEDFATEYNPADDEPEDFSSMDDAPVDFSPAVEEPVDDNRFVDVPDAFEPPQFSPADDDQLASTVVDDASSPAPQVRSEPRPMTVPAGAQGGVPVASTVTLKCMPAEGHSEANLTWVQTEGPRVDLVDHGDGTATFIVPEEAGVMLLFECKGTDGTQTKLNTVSRSQGVPGGRMQLGSTVIGANAFGPLTVDAGDDQTVAVSSWVTLRCAQTSGGPARLTWVQTGGPHVDLFDNGDGTAAFVAPADPDVTVTFKCIGSPLSRTKINTSGGGGAGASPMGPVSSVAQPPRIESLVAGLNEGRSTTLASRIVADSGRRVPSWSASDSDGTGSDADFVDLADELAAIRAEMECWEQEAAAHRDAIEALDELNALQACPASPTTWSVAEAG